MPPGTGPRPRDGSAIIGKWASDDVIDVEKFGKRTHSSNNGITRPLQKVRKREEVDIQWDRGVVSVGIPMS